MFSERFVMTINLLCTLEQWSLILGTIYLVNHGWSAWWFVATLFLLSGSAPTQVFRALSKHSKEPS